MNKVTIVSLLVFLISTPLAAAVFTVEADGSGDAPTITAAVALTADDDTILLGDGIFSGEGNRDIILHEKFIFIESISGNPANCVIDVEGTEADPHFGFQIYITGEKNERDYLPHIAGLTIQGGYQYAGGAVKINDGASAEFENCIFRDNHASDSGGAFLIGYSWMVTLIDCTFLDNGSGAAGGAIEARECANLNIENVLFAGNSAVGSGGAIMGMYSVDVTATNCSFICNDAPEGAVASLGSAGNHTVDKCLLYGNVGSSLLEMANGDITCTDSFGNTCGDWVGDMAPFVDLNGNLGLDPQFCDFAEGNFLLYDSSPCAPANNDCGVRMGARPVGCVIVSTETTTWSSLKTLY
ncbi:MAG: right-handed parallel beta-helix repeat-containing protein [bacterium]|nr:right-handed parallel beta-helix repeat-containing protein [bacterium]